jgi:hypothetical protein
MFENEGNSSELTWKMLKFLLKSVAFVDGPKTLKKFAEAPILTSSAAVVSTQPLKTAGADTSARFLVGLIVDGDSPRVTEASRSVKTWAEATPLKALIPKEIYRENGKSQSKNGKT